VTRERFTAYLADPVDHFLCGRVAITSYSARRTFPIHLPKGFLAGKTV